MRHVFGAMGTVVSVTATELPQTLARSIERMFEDLEAEFSRYRADSPASMIADGRLLMTRASPEHRAMYAEAVSWRNETGGAFDPHRPDRTIDLAGIVKAAAIADAGRILDDAGLADWCVNAGGDVFIRGTVAEADESRPWTVGVVDPFDRTHLLGDLPLTDGRRAIATSGTAERGEHVWRLGSRPAFAYRQVSVVADDIVTADVLATAVLAGGEETALMAVARWSVDVIAVTKDGEFVEHASTRRRAVSDR